MTTANKPTWNPVNARSAQFLTGGQITQQFSSRDMVGQYELKTRKEGQGNKEEIAKRDLLKGIFFKIKNQNWKTGKLMQNIKRILVH